MLKIGALAKQAGVTVRTLHHYEAIGLLSPSSRSASGFRLYTESDVMRLQQIQMLKQMGYALADIQALLHGPDVSPIAMISAQLHALEEQSNRIKALRDQLQRLQHKLADGIDTEMTDWLQALEMMIMQEARLTPDELAVLRVAEEKRSNMGGRWRALVAEVRTAMDHDAQPDGVLAQDLARRWKQLAHEAVDGDARLVSKLTALQAGSPRAQAINGITTAMMDWIVSAFAHARTALLAPYLTPDELEIVRERQLAHLHEWAPLLAQARLHLHAGTDPASDGVADLATRWRALFQASHFGQNRQLELKVRDAFDQEPDLRLGLGVDQALLTYIKSILMHHGPQQMLPHAPAPAFTLP